MGRLLDVGACGLKRWGPDPMFSESLEVVGVPPRPITEEDAGLPLPPITAKFPDAASEGLHMLDLVFRLSFAEEFEFGEIGHKTLFSSRCGEGFDGVVFKRLSWNPSTSSSSSLFRTTLRRFRTGTMSSSSLSWTFWNETRTRQIDPSLIPDGIYKSKLSMKRGWLFNF